MMLACDFFHVDCAVPLRHVYMFFVIEVGTRYVHILCVTAHPDGACTVQQVRNLRWTLGDGASRFRFLIRDRAGQFTDAFGAVLSGAGIEVLAPPGVAKGTPAAVTDLATAKIRRRRVLGGLISEYEQAA
jgi:hypothetical protein